MVISLMTVGQKLTALIMNQLIQAANQTAMTGIVPTSVAGTGVTAAPGGAVTCTNATTVSLNGVFSGTYDNYRITWSMPTRSTANTLIFRLRAAGTDLTSATYDFIRGFDQGTARTVASSSAATSALLDLGIAAGQSSNGVLDLFGPALTSSTGGTAQSALLASSAATSVQAGFTNESTASYDGFTLTLAGGGTFSGLLRVYGYNNLT